MDALASLVDSVKSAAARGVALNVRGGASKSFLKRHCAVETEDLDVRQHSGILAYHPEELVVRARGGTLLADLEQELEDKGQMLAFDPPEFGGGATIGGVVAAGLSGARRPYTGAVKDYLLGVGLVTGEGEYLEFGGQVMKNVAGYDVSRLVCGSHGILGVIADVSLKVVPKPASEQTLRVEMSLDDAVMLFRRLARAASTLSGTAYLDGACYVRFSGSTRAVAEQQASVPGTSVGNDFWRRYDNQQYPEIVSARNLWRLSAPVREPMSHDFTAVDWGGAQRWLTDPSTSPRENYTGQGHWTLFRTSDDSAVDRFHPLGQIEMSLHKKLKAVFDPKGILNRHRMYEDL